MPRFYLETHAVRGDGVTLGVADSHHAARVLRLREGDSIEILDGRGRRLTARIRRVDRRSTEAEVLTLTEVPMPPRVVLAPALIKGKAMDLLVQKATELGVAILCPLALERCVVRAGNGDGEKWVEGWRQTAIEAVKQCGNPWLPEIRPPSALTAFLATRPPGLLLVASLRSGSRRVREIVKERGAVHEAVTLVLGPEGDFTEGEEEQLVGAGAVPMTLGRLVLRAETAAIAGLAVIQHELA